MDRVWVVAHDFSPSADRAARIAAVDAAKLGVRLVLLHVYAVPPAPVGFEWVGAHSGVASWQELEQAVRHESEAQLGRIAQELTRVHADLAIVSRVEEGFAAQRILAVAADEQAERIVVGTHSRRGLSHLLLGSVAERVARDARIPVLVVKAEQAADDVGLQPDAVVA